MAGESESVSRETLPVTGEVHIHCAPLDLATADLVRCRRFLSTDELARADRLLDQQQRDRFVAGRGFLRETLANYLALPPADLCFATGEHGKPKLPGEGGSSALYFNLAHADDQAILAVAGNCEVGIDLERLRDDLPFRAMAQRFYAPRERTELFSLPEEQQLAAFFRCWTRKEAYLKGCGAGFSQPADSFAVSLLPGQPPALLEHRTPGEPARWRIVDLTVAAGYCAALAVAGEPPPVVRYLS
jgi:4'-phosphopantetheinyl transferase